MNVTNNNMCIAGRRNRRLNSRAVEVAFVNKKLIKIFSDDFLLGNCLDRPNHA